MTDNRTTELRRLLDERGVKWTSKPTHPETTWAYDGWWHNAKFEPWGDSTLKVTIYDLTPEKAIAATLGSERHAYEQRITGDGSDWGEIMRSAYDDLMANACESCTSEQMGRLADYIRAELGSGTLTAEQVREAIERNFGKVAVLDDGKPVEWRDDWVCKIGIDYKAIADELNAVLGSGTCEYKPMWDDDDLITGEYVGMWYTGCGDALVWNYDNDGCCEPPAFCPYCGGKVKAVKR